jgi:hypothetical protein
MKFALTASPVAALYSPMFPSSVPTKGAFPVNAREFGAFGIPAIKKGLIALQW